MGWSRVLRVAEGASPVRCGEPQGEREMEYERGEREERSGMMTTGCKRSTSMS